MSAGGARHSVEEGMIATLGLLPGTWVGQVQPGPDLNPAVPEGRCGEGRTRPRPPAFRGCFMAFKRFGGKQRDAHRNSALSPKQLEQHDKDVPSDADDLFQDSCSTGPPACQSRGSRRAWKTPTISQSSANTRMTSPFVQSCSTHIDSSFCDITSIMQPSRPGSRISRGSKASSRRAPQAQAQLSWRVDVPCVSTSVQAYKKLATIRPRCGAWGQARNTEVTRPSQVGHIEELEEEEAKAWQIQLPMGHMWNKTRKVPKWDFCRVTGPWANRMRSGSLANYRQWGPDGSGPLWVLEDAK